MKLISEFASLLLRANLKFYSLGKTTILYKIKVKKMVTTVPTIGFNVETIKVRDGVEFTVWDVGGQNMLRTTWNHYYETTDGTTVLAEFSFKNNSARTCDHFRPHICY